jgi:thiol-disulfide isomerase/thioredoxin
MLEDIASEGFEHMYVVVPARWRLARVLPIFGRRLGVLLLVAAMWNPGGALARSPAGAPATPSHAGLGRFHQVSGTPWLYHGKPVVLFVGAQYCPFCAAERWALVMALGRFGQWSGLGQMHSTHGESGFPSLPTYDLLHATYRSGAIALQEREVADFAGRPLQPLTPEQSRAVDAYDPHGSIPFQLIGGRYAQISSGYSPGLLIGLSFDQAHALVYQQPDSKLSRAVTGEANIISALICSELGPPAHSMAGCRLPAVQALLSRLS